MGPLAVAAFTLALTVLTVIAQVEDSPILKWIDTGGLIGLFAVIVLGAIRGWWVPGIVYERVVRERDRLLELALRSASTSEQAASVLREKTPTPGEIEDITRRAVQQVVDELERRGR